MIALQATVGLGSVSRVPLKPNCRESVVKTVEVAENLFWTSDPENIYHLLANRCLSRIRGREATHETSTPPKDQDPRSRSLGS